MNDLPVSHAPNVPKSRMAEFVHDIDWQQVEFKGKGREWFGIWIVNICLTVVTLGIYSAWAKVRFKKYFYQNTYVAGRNLNYHARPLAILKARVIMVVAFLLSLPFAVWLGPLLLLPLFLLFPVALVFGARFNAHNTSWANVRFDFDGKISGAYGVYVLLPFLALFTLYLAYPLVKRAMHDYVVTGHTLGGRRFSFTSAGWPYYRSYLLAFAVGIVATATIGFALMPLAALFGEIGSASLMDLSENRTEPQLPAFVLAWYFAGFIGSQLGFVVLSVGLRNVLVNRLQLLTDGDGLFETRVHRFRSTASIWQVAVLVTTNLLLVVVSLGLALPWTKIRYHRYMANHTFVHINGNLEDLVTVTKGETSALGDAYGDVEGLDVGLGF